MGKGLSLALILVAVLSTRALADGVPGTFGQPIVLKNGQRATVGTLKVGLTARHVPFQRGPGGIEQFPITYYALAWEEKRDKTVEKTVLENLLPSRKGEGRQGEIFGRYTFTFEQGKNADEATLTVFKRHCLLRYTSRNQLKHPDGKIIFTENEDLCCYYSDGKNTCDPRVVRAQPRPQASKRYCVLHSHQPELPPSEEKCCCRYEGGEPLDKLCEAECKRLGVGP